MKQRHREIADLIEQRGFLSVKDLSEHYRLSEVTIRRDLQLLEENRYLKRTHGGAIALHVSDTLAETNNEVDKHQNHLYIDDLDAIIATSVNPDIDHLLMERAKICSVPVISESSAIVGAKTLVAVDSEGAAQELGEWTANHLRSKSINHVRLLDLTYRLGNTRKRSKFFVNGMKMLIQDVEVVLSINAQSDREIAHQLTLDALQVYEDINVIFAINGATGLGAIDACTELGIPPETIVLVTFGLEGDKLRDALLDGTYCKAGVAVFPEIFAPICIQAAVKAIGNEELPENIATPHRILTADNMHDYYVQEGSKHVLDFERLKHKIELPFGIDVPTKIVSSHPLHIGMIIPFRQHPWYRNLERFMSDYAGSFGIILHLIDAETQFREEVKLRQHDIAHRAASIIHSGDVILLGDGVINSLLAEKISEFKDITVVTNSMAVFDALRDSPSIELILTGGSYSANRQAFVGRTAEQMLTEMRVDKLFLEVEGISIAFGLSVSQQVDASLKKAMIRSAHHVILLAAHPQFLTETTVQVAPMNAVHQVITDNGLSASTRLTLSSQEINVILSDPNNQDSVAL